LLLRAAASASRDDESTLLAKARTELEAAHTLRLRIQDPRAQESAARLAEIEQGLLTHYPLRPSSTQGEVAGVSPAARDCVFISYSHKDKAWLESLRTLLKPLMRQNALSLWADTDIQPGAKWHDEIENAMARAKVAVLLVSADFLASDFIAEKELPPLLAAAEREGIRILWIYLSPCLYKATPIAAYQAAHDLAKSLAEMTTAEQQRVLLQVAEAIHQAAVAAG
jgi:hypothetical protein